MAKATRKFRIVNRRNEQINLCYAILGPIGSSLTTPGVLYSDQADIDLPYDEASDFIRRFIGNGPKSMSGLKEFGEHDSIYVAESFPIAGGQWLHVPIEHVYLSGDITSPTFRKLARDAGHDEAEIEESISTLAAQGRIAENEEEPTETKAASTRKTNKKTAPKADSGKE